MGVNFQKLLVGLQVDRDERYLSEIAAMQEHLPEYKKTVVLYDRGVMDGQAYVGKEEFESLLDQMNLKRSSVMCQYDGVFHLVTAAQGAEQFYTTANNEVRSETPEQAIELDSKTMNCWVGHPHLRVIKNDGVNFDQKMTILMAEIMSLLGEPEPMEIERKFLIHMPDEKELVQKHGAVKTTILQTYLTSKDPNTERRVRMRGEPDDYTYYYTEKRKVSKGTREETERKISVKEYKQLIEEADKSKSPIKKDRYCFVYNGKYFELDIYPFWEYWKDKAIVEIELKDINEQFEFPEFISMISEVTDDNRYSNANLASTFGNIE